MPGWSWLSLGSKPMAILEKVRARSLPVSPLIALSGAFSAILASQRHGRSLVHPNLSQVYSPICPTKYQTVPEYFGMTRLRMPETTRNDWHETKTFPVSVENSKRFACHWHGQSAINEQRASQSACNQRNALGLCRCAVGAGFH